MPTDTNTFKLKRPEFNAVTWHDEVNGNMTILDTVISTYISGEGIRGLWANSTNYQAGQKVVDPDDGKLYACVTPHTSASLGSFAADRAVRPDIWIIKDSIGGAASLVDYTPSNGLTATDVQSAINEIRALQVVSDNALHNIQNNAQNSSVVGLTATRVPTALDSYNVTFSRATLVPAALDGTLRIMQDFNYNASIIQHLDTPGAALGTGTELQLFLVYDSVHNVIGAIYSRNAPHNGPIMTIPSRSETWTHFCYLFSVRVISSTVVPNVFVVGDRVEFFDNPQIGSFSSSGAVSTEAVRTLLLSDSVPTWAKTWSVSFQATMDVSGPGGAIDRVSFGMPTLAKTVPDSVFIGAVVGTISPTKFMNQFILHLSKLATAFEYRVISMVGNSTTTRSYQFYVQGYTVPNGAL